MRVPMSSPGAYSIDRGAITSRGTGAAPIGNAALAGTGASPYLFAGLAGIQVWAGIQQAAMIREQAGLQRKLSDLNAKYAAIDSYNALNEGYSQSARYQTTIDQTVGQQREGYSSEDVDVNFGSAKQVQAETRNTGFLNQIDIMNQARSKALGYTQESRNITLNADMNDSQAAMSASAAQTAGIVSAASTGISAYARS